MASVQGVYLALFGRPADPAGLAYWTAQSKNGTDLSKIIDTMTKLPEATARFAGLTDAALITSIYQSLFDRAPDAAGLAFFTAQLQSGKQTIGSIAINILDGAQGTDLTLIQNREKAANVFTATLDTPAEISAYSGTSAADFGRSFIKGITVDPASVPTANQAQSAINNGLPGASGGQAPGGGGGDGGAPTLASVSSYDTTTKTLTIATNAQATVNVTNGNYQISANNFAPTSIAAADISKIIVNSGAKLNIAGTELASKAYAVSGNGTLNATGVTFVQADAKTNDGNVDNVKFEASSEFDPRLITSKFEVNGSVADGFKARWDFIDDNYSYYNTSINEAGVKLGLAYYDYLKAGGEPLTQIIVKADDGGRLQSMHDNLLGNLHEPSIRDKFFDSTGGGSNGGNNGTADNALGQQLLDAVAAAGAGGRPYYGGNVSENVNGGAGDLARAWDYAHGLQRTDYVEQYASSKVDVSAIKNGKEMYYGAGNTVDGFNIIRHEGAGIEIGLKAKVRGGEDYAGIKQSDGVVEYHVGSGDAGRADRSKWSFDFSVTTGLNNTNKTLADFDFKAYVDIDKTDAVNYIEFDMTKLGAGNTPWILKGSSPATGFADEDGTNANLSQNSVNFGFNFIRSLIDKDDPNTAAIEQYDYTSGTFDIKFEGSNTAGVLVSNHIRVIVDDGLGLTT